MHLPIIRILFLQIRVSLKLSRVVHISNLIIRDIHVLFNQMYLLGLFRALNVAGLLLLHTNKLICLLLIDSVCRLLSIVLKVIVRYMYDFSAIRQNTYLEWILRVSHKIDETNELLSAISLVQEYGMLVLQTFLLMNIEYSFKKANLQGYMFDKI